MLYLVEVMETFKANRAETNCRTETNYRKFANLKDAEDYARRKSDGLYHQWLAHSVEDFSVIVFQSID